MREAPEKNAGIFFLYWQNLFYMQGHIQGGVRGAVPPPELRAFTIFNYLTQE